MSSSKLPEAAATGGGSSGGASEVTPTTAAARSLLDHPIEHSMLKVPAAYLNTVFRSYTHSVERELSQALETVAKLAEPSHDGSNAITLSGHEVYQSVEHLVGRLKGLKRKLDETNVTEKKQLQRVKTRLECLQKASASSSPDSGSPAGEDTTFWEQVRLNRALTDHLLRAGHLHAALQLAKDSGVEAFLDQEIFQRAQQVRTALSQKDCGPCLSWCAENRNRLRKLQSTLELNLRMQEFIELARVGSFVEAISYARKHFVSAMKDPDAQPKLQRVFTAIAFQRNTQCPPYKVLFDERRWTDLQTEFQQDLCRLYSLPSHSLLEITMQAGLSFFKTRLCYEDHEIDFKTNCPVCTPQMARLAEPLPFPQLNKAYVICALTQQLMDYDEYAPMALPNGFVYSKKGLEEMAAAAEGMVTCPKTGKVYPLSEAKRAFFV